MIVLNFLFEITRSMNNGLVGLRFTENGYQSRQVYLTSKNYSCPAGGVKELHIREFMDLSNILLLFYF